MAPCASFEGNRHPAMGSGRAEVPVDSPIRHEPSPSLVSIKRSSAGGFRVVVVPPIAHARRRARAEEHFRFARIPWETRRRSDTQIGTPERIVSAAALHPRTLEAPKRWPPMMSSSPIGCTPSRSTRTLRDLDEGLRDRVITCSTACSAVKVRTAGSAVLLTRRCPSSIHADISSSGTTSLRAHHAPIR